MLNTLVLALVSGLSLMAEPAAPAAKPIPPDPTAAAQTADCSPQVTEGIVNAPPAEVWKVFTTSEGFTKLGVAKCEIDFRVGGLMRSHYDPKGVLGDPATIQNQIIAYETERMLAFRIFQPPKGFPFENAWKNTWSVVTLTDMGDGRTHVRLAGVGYDTTEESQKMREFFRAGNAWVMKTLQSKFDAAAPAPTGSAHPASSLDPIEKEIVLQASKADAWKLFATSDGWKSMIADDATIELRPGGKFEIAFDTSAPKGQQGSEGCTVLSYIPQEVLSFSWNAPPKLAFARSQRTWVVLRFDSITPLTTRVRLSHQGFTELAAQFADHTAEFEETRGYFDRAWGKVLEAAKAREKTPPASAARGD